MGGGHGLIDPDRWSPRFAAFFGWYAERLFRGRFHSVRLAPGSAEALVGVAACPGPALVAMNHASWWDPMVAVLLWRRFFPRRSNLSPMEAAQLRRFGFMRRLGIFGIDPDDPASLQAMGTHVARRLRELPRPVVILTPQGRFVDARLPVEPRPGAAALLSANAGMRAWSVAIEYGFWSDAKPEVFVRAVPVTTPEDVRVTGWQRALRDAMQANQCALTQAVQARDPAAFEVLVGATAARVHPVYDAWLSASGRGRGIDLSGREPA